MDDAVGMGEGDRLADAQEDAEPLADVAGPRRTSSDRAGRRARSFIA